MPLQNAAAASLSGPARACPQTQRPRLGGGYGDGDNFGGSVRPAPEGLTETRGPEEEPARRGTSRNSRYAQKSNRCRQGLEIFPAECFNRRGFLYNDAGKGSSGQGGPRPAPPSLPYNPPAPCPAPDGRLAPARAHAGSLGRRSPRRYRTAVTPRVA
jgi:hypothetical protein